MYEPTFETGEQTRCTKTKAGGDVFWARFVTSHVAEMLTSRRVGSTVEQALRLVNISAAGVKPTS
jgi:hypothetical protein